MLAMLAVHRRACCMACRMATCQQPKRLLGGPGLRVDTRTSQSDAASGAVWQGRIQQTARAKAPVMSPIRRAALGCAGGRGGEGAAASPPWSSPPVQPAALLRARPARCGRPRAWRHCQSPGAAR